MNGLLRLLRLCQLVPSLEGFASEFPDRMFDVGIAEQHAATVAAGLGNTKNETIFSDLFNLSATCL